jgi:hypothetical protein
LTRAVVLAFGIAALATGCMGDDARSDRPEWLTEALEQRLTRNALLVSRKDPDAEIARAFVVRSNVTDVSRLGGWGDPRTGTVYVLELSGELTLCHGVTPEVDPCARTDGITVVYDGTTLRTRDVVYGRLGAEQLGPAFDLSIPQRD